ncbi:MAG: IPT/TIG domain-containing protein [Bacillota bacterium]
MKRAILFLCTLILFLLTGQAWAQTTQQLGFPDRTYGALTEMDCRSCHGSTTQNRHHLSLKALVVTCDYCHQSLEGKITAVSDCKICHVKDSHHLTQEAQLGQCTACHYGDVVDDYGLATTAVTDADINKCRLCHTEGLTSLHHEEGLQQCSWCHSSNSGGISVSRCLSCHQSSKLHFLHGGECNQCHGSGTSLPDPELPQPRPVLVQISATEASPGAILSLNGTGFGGSGWVQIGPLKAELLQWSNNYLQIRLPDLNAGNYPVTVVNSNGSSNQLNITILAPAVATRPEIHGMPDKTYEEVGEEECRNCHGTSTADRHHLAAAADQRDCSACHLLTAPGQVEVVRKCQQCHASSPHHRRNEALSGQCTACHLPALVQDWDINSNGTIVENTAMIPGLRSCEQCHPYPGPGQNHHGTGLENCNLCHEIKDKWAIRRCQACHRSELLHGQAGHKLAADCGKCHAGGLASSLAEAIAPNATPVVLQIEPEQSYAGDTVTISGAGFGTGPGQVQIGSTLAAVTSWNENNIQITIPSLPPGSYQLTVVKNGVISNARGFTVLEWAQLSGQVMSASLAPLEEAVVYVGTTRLRTNEKGYFSLGKLAPGVYNVTARKEGLTDQQVVSLVAGEKKSIQMIASKKGWTSEKGAYHRGTIIGKNTVYTNTHNDVSAKWTIKK